MRQNIEQYVKKARYFISDHSLVLSVGVFLVLLSGLFLTVYQVSIQQESRSRAASPLLPHVNCSMPSAESNQNADEKKLFDLVNKYRKDNGVPELLPDETFDRAASWLAIDMAKKNKFSHTDTLGREPGKRVVDCGFYGDKNQVRENIEKGSTTPEEVFAAWKKSQTHNETMLDERMQIAGVGQKEIKSSKSGKVKKNCQKTKSGCQVEFKSYYWVMDFAVKPDVANVTDTTPKPTCALDDSDTTVESVGAGGAMVGGNNKKKAADKKKADAKKKADDKKKNDNKNKKKKNNKGKAGNTDGTEDTTQNDTGDGTTNNSEDCVTPANENPDGGDTTTPTDDPDATDAPEVTEPLAPSLQFAVNIPGSEDLGDIRDLTVDFTDLNGKTVTTETIEIENFEGDSYIGYLEYGQKIPTGIYKVRVKLDDSLRKAIKPDFQKIDSTKDIDLPAVILVMGDFDNNNILNIFDFNIFKNCMDVALYEEEFVDEEEDSEAETFAKSTRVLATSCSLHYETDLNGDGTVDLLDYNLLLESFQTVKVN